METEENQVQRENRKKKLKQDDNFIAPDGGWGWIIVIASGFSNFAILPMLQCFGLIFKEHFAKLGISSSETTTLFNTNCAIMSCIGLANGPLFRKFTFRQVAFVGAVVSAISICILSKMKSFTGFMFFFSIIYGIGVGITMAANALALNTYFKNKRRIATGLAWTCTGSGTIIMPHIITFLLPLLGMEGTVLVYGGFALNAIACSLLLQPVTWHVKNKNDEMNKKLSENFDPELSYTECKVQMENQNLENTRFIKSSETESNRHSQKFGSQFLYYDDEEEGPAGIDIIDPATPMMSRANDGWFSKKNTSATSLTSKSSKQTRVTSRRSSMIISRDPSVVTVKNEPPTKNINRYSNENIENWRRKIVLVNGSDKDKKNNTQEETHRMLPDKSVVFVEKNSNELISNTELQECWLKQFFEAVVIFFDLDLLRDPVYVNLMMGITIANFTELNFALLTPFILSDYGFAKVQVATIMSILGGVDVLTRLTIPFIATYIGWENRTFFLIGISMIAMGRIVLAHIDDYNVSIMLAVLIGVGKAMRTIFMALVIPTHVPLSRLPAASGLQLLVSGLFYLALGPAVGWIKDTTGNYTVILHCLNLLTYITVISWSLEVFITKWKKNRMNSDNTAMN